MSSLFLSRRPEEEHASAEGGSGGKILRRRRCGPPSASPYLRPRHSGSPRWSLGGLISGAGKLISSVLPYHSSQTSTSTSTTSSSDDDHAEDYTEDEDEHDFPSKEHQELPERGKDAQFNNNFIDGTEEITPKNKSKHALVQLLMQETFSRGECDELIKLIQSRVVDIPTSEVFGGRAVEFPRQINGNDLTLLGVSGPFKQSQRLLETPPYTSRNVFSPASSSYKEQTLDMCNRAVMEAKKWFEEKKLASNSKYDSEYGPCTMNTDVLHYDIDGQQGSPVDTAKSYMQSLPPWRSPLLSSIGFKTPSPNRTHHCYKRISYATINHSLTSSEIFKRDRVAIGSCDTLEETRRVRLKATEGLDTPKSKQIESSKKTSEHDFTNMSSETAKSDLYAGDNCANGSLGEPNDKVELKNPLESSNVYSSNTISDPEETMNVVQLTNGSAIPSHPTKQTHDIGENQSTQAIENGSFNMLKDAEEKSHTMEQIDEGQSEGISVPEDSHPPSYTSIKHDEIPSCGVKVLPPESIKSAEPQYISDAVDPANANEAHTSNLPPVADSYDSYPQLNLVSGVEVIKCMSVPDTRSQEGNSQIPNVVNGSIGEVSGNVSFSDVNTNSDHETLSKELGNSAQNGTRMKSIERILTGPQPRMPRRRRKVVVTQRKARGKS